MVSSPYLAMRVLKQLANDERQKFPIAATVLDKETYMDDSLSGGHSFEEALKKRDEFIKICKSGGFQLHKWLANDIRLFESVSSKLKSSEHDFNEPHSVLGLSWEPSSDEFIYRIKIEKLDDSLTKRKILS